MFPRLAPGHRKGFGGCTFHFLLCRLPGPDDLAGVHVLALQFSLRIHVESAKDPLIEYLRCLFTVLGRPILAVKTCSSGFHIAFSTSWLDDMLELIVPLGLGDT